MFKKDLAFTSFLISVLTLALYYYPFFKYSLTQIDLSTFSGVFLLVNVVILLLAMNTFATYLILFLLKKVGKYLIALTFIINSVALYFINTYNILVDKNMIGNVLNTNVEEAGSFFSLPLILYVLFLGIAPSILLFKFQPIKESIKRFLMKISIGLVLVAAFAYFNSSSWLWVDKNVPTLGSLAMPWCYVVNVVRYTNAQRQKNKVEKRLPKLEIKDKKKSVVVLVIGESTRKKNMSLYGYEKPTTPLLSQLPDLHVYQAESADTYTIAGVKAILDYKKTNEFVEPLPTYLHRNGVNVVWRSTNTGEPKLSVTKRETVSHLKTLAQAENLSTEHDELLLAGLKEEILESENPKIFITLHTSTSHGPTYFKKYPARFSKFEPVCTGVELSEYSQEELMNAYDNTIVYTDYLLATLIEKLSSLKDFSSTVLFVSDHGESLGESGFYMHGIPKKMAPEVQYEIPFLVWSNDTTLHFKQKDLISQYHVFHTIMDALGLESPIYNADLSLIEKEEDR